MLSTPNVQKALDDALETLEFMISVDPALNETTRHADGDPAADVPLGA